MRRGLNERMSELAVQSAVACQASNDAHDYQHDTNPDVLVVHWHVNSVQCHL